MIIEIGFKGHGMNFREALAAAIGAAAENVEVIVTPPVDTIAFRADWRVVQSCPDVCAKVKGEYLLLNQI